MHNTKEDVLARAKKIKLMIFDIDGVMTDGGLTIGDDGQEYKTFNSQDGLGLKLLKSSGVELAIITGRTSNVVTKRAENIGVEYLYQGVEDKLSAYQALIKKLGFQPEETGFMGDDIVDLPPMLRCGLGVSVPAAFDVVKTRAHYVTTREAGKGAVREVCELIMQAQETYDDITAPYLQ